MNELESQISDGLSAVITEFATEHPHATRSAGYVILVVFGVMGLVSELKAATA